MSNNNTIPKPENPTQGHMTAVDTKPKLIANTKSELIADMKLELITITKTGAKIPRSHNYSI